MTVTYPPPKLLVGASLMFWGSMTGKPLIGLIMALVAESSNWLRWRWNFDEAAIARAWHLILTLSIGFTALLLIDGERQQLLPILLGWLPVLLLPLHLAQIFGLRPTISLTSLSFFAKRRRDRNQRFGIENPEIQFHFGNVYFVMVLVASTLGIWADARLFLPGILLLCLWRFLAYSSACPRAVVMIFICAGMLAWLGQISFNHLYHWLSRGGQHGSNWHSDAAHGFTAIGSMRDMKLSREIRWRIQLDEGEHPPKLLRRASFNRYRGNNWETVKIPQAGGSDGQFIDLDTIEPVLGEAYYIANPQMDGASATSSGLARFRMRGSTHPGGAFPLPGNTASFRDFDLDAAQRNSLGTIRIFPAASIIHGSVLWQAETGPDPPPNPQDDLRLPPLEAEMIQRVATSIGISKKMSTLENMKLIQSWFQKKFRYSLYLSMLQPKHSIREKTAIGQFLEDTQTGHCEYFATAATLLLRTANVPARYTTGYAVIEHDARHQEFVIRGVHGHAWCRVWLNEENRWIDFDPTPANWQALEQIHQIPQKQKVQDTLKRYREDFFIWRSDPKNRELLIIIISIPGMLGGSLLAWRLWKSRDQSQHPTAMQSSSQGIPSPLFKIEPLAAKHLGPRPAGTPYAQWITKLETTCPELESNLKQALVLHQALRFDPVSIESDVLVEMERLMTAIRATLRKSRPPDRKQSEPQSLPIG